MNSAVLQVNWNAGLRLWLENCWQSAFLQKISHSANSSQHSDVCPPKPDIGRTTGSGNRQLVMWRKNVECIPTSCFKYLTVHFTTSSADKPVFKMPWKREEAIWLRVGRQITKYATRRATAGIVWNTDKCYTWANQSYSLKTYDVRRRHIRQHAICFRRLRYLMKQRTCKKLRERYRHHSRKHGYLLLIYLLTYFSME